MTYDDIGNPRKIKNPASSREARDFIVSRENVC